MTELLRNYDMHALMTEKGLLIPNEWLRGLEELEIRRIGQVIMIMPAASMRLKVAKTGENSTDPLLTLGTDPIDDVLTDASINHDTYGDFTPKPLTQAAKSCKVG
ncbi:MAG: hypothetical protein GY862_08480 [Gammaproteobacteria bacterium]|nr:hypothetical protein [Gammaproteobacteria bacterium]